MKPYQFYLLDRFPMLEPGQSVRNQIQMTFFGADEDVETTITLETEKFEQSLDLLRVKSEIKHSTMGFIKVVEDDGRRRYDFSGTLSQWNPRVPRFRRKLLLFQAPKRCVKASLPTYAGIPAALTLPKCRLISARFWLNAASISARGSKASRLACERRACQATRFRRTLSFVHCWPRATFQVSPFLGCTAVLSIGSW